MEQVEIVRGVDISKTLHLIGKERLSGSTPKQTTQHAVCHVHLMRYFLKVKYIHFYYCPETENADDSERNGLTSTWSLK